MNKISVFVLFSFTLISILFITPIASEAVTVGNWLCYKVVESSETNNYFYGAWPPGEYYGNWSVEIGDLIWFNITSVSVDCINGTITLGSFTFHNVRNIDVASALVISVYPWYGGFITNSSAILSEANDFRACNTTVSVINDYYQEVNDHNITIAAIKIETLDYYGQNSLFYYSSSTGILLKAYTSFGDYSLGIELIKTDIALKLENSEKLLMNFWLVVLLIVIIPIVKRKRSQNI